MTGLAQNFDDLKRLGEKVVRPDVPGLHSGVEFAFARHNDNWKERCGRIGFDSPADLETRHAGHVDVEKDEIGFLMGNRFQSRLPVPDARNLVAFHLQYLFESCTDKWVVVHHQNSPPGRFDHAHSNRFQSRK